MHFHDARLSNATDPSITEPRLRRVFIALVVPLASLAAACGGGGGGGAAAVAELSNLELSIGELTPAFDPAVFSYTASVGFLASSVEVTAAAAPTVNLTVDGDPLTSGEPSGSRSLAVGANSIAVSAQVGAATVTYTVEVERALATTVTQDAYIKPSNTASDFLFGNSSALDGDLLAVGAYFENGTSTGINGDESAQGGSRCGAVYVYADSGAGWVPEAYIKPGVIDDFDFFGWSIDLDGDTLVVGAIQEDGGFGGVNGDATDNSAGSSGAAYVFVRDNGVWTQEAYLKAAFPDPSDRFGEAVAISGDTLVVGASGDDSGAVGVGGDQVDVGAPDSGAAYVFVRENGVWTQQAFLKPIEQEPGARFGSSLDIEGDTIVVGAPNMDLDLKFGAGQVTVFTRVGAEWSLTDTLERPSPVIGDGFGSDVALDGDLIVVGAEDAEVFGVRSGAAYVFDRSSGSWVNDGELLSPSLGSGDLFGQFVAIEGTTIAVGARREDGNSAGLFGDPTDDTGSDVGATYVYTRDAGGAWTTALYVKAAAPDDGDEFGEAVTLNGGRLLVGATEEASNATGVGGGATDDSAAGAGAAYLFE